MWKSHAWHHGWLIAPEKCWDITFGTILYHNSSHDELWLVKMYYWVMWRHTLTNYNSSVVSCDTKLYQNWYPWPFSLRIHVSQQRETCGAGIWCTWYICRVTHTLTGSTHCGAHLCVRDLVYTPGTAYNFIEVHASKNM